MDIFKKKGYRSDEELLKRAIDRYSELNEDQRTGFINNCIVVAKILPYLHTSIATTHIGNMQAVEILPEPARERIKINARIIKDEIVMAMENIKDIDATPIELLLSYMIAVNEVATDLLEVALKEYVIKDVFLEITAITYSKIVKNLKEIVKVRGGMYEIDFSKIDKAVEVK